MVRQWKPVNTRNSVIKNARAFKDIAREKYQHKVVEFLCRNQGVAKSRRAAWQANNGTSLTPEAFHELCPEFPVSLDVVKLDKVSETHTVAAFFGDFPVLPVTKAWNNHRQRLYLSDEDLSGVVFDWPFCRGLRVDLTDDQLLDVPQNSKVKTMRPPSSGVGLIIHNCDVTHTGDPAVRLCYHDGATQLTVELLTTFLCTLRDFAA